MYTETAFSNYELQRVSGASLVFIFDLRSFSSRVLGPPALMEDISQFYTHRGNTCNLTSSH